VSGPGTAELAQLRTASQSDVGRARRDNQDAFGEFASAAGERLLVVADGMGGHVGGATASRICVEALGAALLDGDGSAEARLARGLVLANGRIRDAAARQPELAGMGTTAVALLFESPRTAWLGWVGDSRAYRARGGEIEALSSDHSVVAEWVRAGILEPHEAEHHPRRNELLRALGASADVEPEIRELDVRPHDRFLLCSDGLSAVVPLEEIRAVVAFEEPELAAKKLVAMANERGGPDNVTVLIAVAGEEVARPAAPETRALSGVRMLSAVAAAIAIGLLATILYGLASGGGGLPSRVPAGTPGPTEVDVQRFIAAWESAANAHDAPALRGLGFELTPEQLERDFPRDGGRLDVTVLSREPVSEDLLGLRLRVAYTHPGRAGTERREEERAILVRASAGALRYAGSWQ
jgi:PPM family protein phosphatase